MNATLRSSGIQEISKEGEGPKVETLEIGDCAANPVTVLFTPGTITPANQAAKLMLLSLLARYDLGTENDS